MEKICLNCIFFKPKAIEIENKIGSSVVITKKLTSGMIQYKGKEIKTELCENVSGLKKQIDREGSIEPIMIVYQNDSCQNFKSK